MIKEKHFCTYEYLPIRKELIFIERGHKDAAQLQYIRVRKMTKHTAKRKCFSAPRRT